MTTTTAVAHHSAANNHASLAESAPENIGPKKPPEMVLFVACISMASNTLPRVLLKTQVKTTVHETMNTMSDQGTSPTTISGRCQKAHSTPRIRLANNADRPTCRRGRAYPLQPGSSQLPPKPGMRSRMKNVEKRPVQPPNSTAEGA